MKRVVTVVLMLFVAASFLYLVVGEPRAGPSATESPAAAERGAEPALPGNEGPKKESGIANERRAPVVVAYYFHGTMRCPTCLTMERYAREAIHESFGADIQAGLVEWQSVDYDESANGHFVQEYSLSASALVVVSTDEDGATDWRNLKQIWDLVSNEAEFKTYVVDAVQTMLRDEK